MAAHAAEAALENAGIGADELDMIIVATVSADTYAVSYTHLSDEDDAAIYFSSGTTGFPKAILHNHESLMHACKVEQKHHGQTHDCLLYTSRCV